MQKLVGLIGFGLSNFGPIIVFYGVYHWAGLKPAIVIATVFSILEIVSLKLRKKEVSALLWFSSACAFVFGGLDLSLSTPIFFKYEPTLTNVITGIFFGLTLLGRRKPLIQDTVEKMHPGEQMSAERAFSCRVLTVIWTIYFFVKAGIYAWVSMNYSIDQALLIRSTYGTASFYILLGASLFLTKRVFAFLRGAGILPHISE